VFRNSVEEVIIHLGCTVNFGINWGRVGVDLALRRGDRIVRGFLSSDSQSNWQVARNTTEAATAITYGAVTLGNIRATANDGDGNRYVLITDQTATPVSDLGNGSLTQNAATNNTFDFGIGSEIGGSGAAHPNWAQDLAQQYIATQIEEQRVVIR
jgi:hypothetical protein